MSRYAHLAYTPTVRAVQAERGSALAAGRRLRAPADRRDPLGPAEAAFLAGLDGFLLGSVGETGWPYIQFRGGPPGFLHVLDERTVAFADVGGNRQYITTGNLRGDDRVALFFLDHARAARLKMYGRATVSTEDERPELAALLQATRTEGRVERLVVIAVEGWDWNCHRHITPRFSERELSEVLEPTRRRLAQVDRLERENAALREELLLLREAL
ncbi:pyridoxamine 5'-phosphate oxidase family protein [Streptomyces sp. NPDC059906]|uniref:pyridoxamine 5'-phosphate oxidase family protein n=1 Tax=Streptomyces sp. NPDC059906 TaxID=3346997 RepID=UPI0036484FF6